MIDPSEIYIGNLVQVGRTVCTIIEIKGDEITLVYEQKGCKNFICCMKNNLKTMTKVIKSEKK